MAVTVMYRTKGYNPEGGDWYWAKYNPDGTIAQMPPEMGSNEDRRQGQRLHHVSR